MCVYMYMYLGVLCKIALILDRRAWFECCVKTLDVFPFLYQRK